MRADKWVMPALLTLPGLLFAADAVRPCGECKLRIEGGGAAAIRVQAERVPLARVLDEIESWTGVRVHYPVLADEPISAICEGATVREVIECLTGAGSNLMFRYGRETATGDRSGRLEELWVVQMGARETGPPNGTGRSGNAAAGDAARLAESAETDIRTLMALATADQPVRRAQGLARLVAEAPADDNGVRTRLEAALSDPDAGVREQAVAGLAKLGGDGLPNVLQQAMRDGDASVRLMAVSKAAADASGTALLQAALADADETVRALAAMKLEPRGRSGAAN